MFKISNSLLLFPLVALGIYLGSLSSSINRPLLYSFVLFVFLWLRMAYKGKKIANLLFILLITLGAIVIGQMTGSGEQAWTSPQKGQYTGSVYSKQELSFDIRLLVRLEGSGWKVAVHLPKDVSIEVGDELTFCGSISQPSQAPNPGVFCYRDYLRSLGVFGICYPTQYEVDSAQKQGTLVRIRGWLRSNIVKHVRQPGLVLALVLGMRDELETSRRESWQRMGISHLLAISGMHVGLVALGLGLAVHRLPVPALVKLSLVQAFLLAYIILAGTGASGWRALLVSSLGGYASFKGSRQDPLHLWATVGWLLLLAKPSLLFDKSFTLSFAASGGILLWVPSIVVKYNSRVLSYIVNSLIISTIAQLSLVPLLMQYFGQVALMAPLATLVFLPCVVILLTGGVLVAVGLGSFGLGSVLNGIMNIVEALESFLVPMTWQVELRSLGQIDVLLWWGVFVYSGWRLRQPRLTRPRRTYAQLITVVIVVLFIICLPPVFRRPLEITALNVGQGDCYFIRTPSGSNILIDGGGDSPYWQERGRNVGEERVVPYLQHRQIERLDYVFLSHPHDDHLFGLLAVLEHFEVGMVVDNGHEHTSQAYERYIELIEEKRIPYYAVRSGHNLDLGDGISLSVLYPSELRPTIPSAHNNNSLLLRLQYGGIRLLFTGDLESAVLYDLSHDASIDVRAQWLKIPHHGSRYSLVESFYHAVDPKWAVISVGPNSFGHPHQEVLETLEQRKITWRSTTDGPETFQVWWGLWGRFKRSSS